MPAVSSLSMAAAPGLSHLGLPLHGIEVTVWALSTAPLTGAVLEMSPRDLRLLVSGDVTLGSVLELELRSEPYDFTCSIRGQVHWRIEGEGAIALGVFLNRALPHEVVGPYWSDLRKELRYDCDWSCQLYSPRRRRTHSACLLNYSRSGVLLASDFPAVAGDELSLLDASRPDSQPIVTGVVRWQAPHFGIQKLLGCELTQDDGVRMAAYLRSVRGGA
jgi:hypothetical protein